MIELPDDLPAHVDPEVLSLLLQKIPSEERAGFLHFVRECVAAPEGTRDFAVAFQMPSHPEIEALMQRLLRP